MKQKLKIILNKYAWVLLLVVYFSIENIDYQKGYFKHDVDTFQNTINKYNLYLTVFAIVLTIAIIALRSSSKNLLIDRLKKNLF